MDLQGSYPTFFQHWNNIAGNNFTTYSIATVMFQRGSTSSHVLQDNVLKAK
jgi:hypothetical protein